MFKRVVLVQRKPLNSAVMLQPFRCRKAEVNSLDCLRPCFHCLICILYKCCYVWLQKAQSSGEDEAECSEKDDAEGLCQCLTVRRYM